MFIQSFLLERSFGVSVAPLFKSCTSKRLVASCPQPYSASKLTTLSTLSWRAQIRLLLVCGWFCSVCVCGGGGGGMSLNRVERTMQLCVNNAQDCVSENSFRFSASKIVCIHFYQQYGFFLDPNILLGKQPIKVVKEAKFNGLVFDTKLIFKNHVQDLKSSCQKPLLCPWPWR